MCRSPWHERKMGMHHGECGCHHGPPGPMMRKRSICAMVFCGFMAMLFMMIAAMLHLKLHLMEE